MPDIAPPKSPVPAAESVPHPELRRFSLRRAHDRLWARLWHFLRGDARHKVIRWVLWSIRAIVTIVDLPLRWLARRRLVAARDRHAVDQMARRHQHAIDQQRMLGRHQQVATRRPVGQCPGAVADRPRRLMRRELPSDPRLLRWLNSHGRRIIRMDDAEYPAVG